MISQEGIDLIKKWEGFRLLPYKDAGGKATIGYGHLIKADENFDRGISLPDAEILLLDDVVESERAVALSLLGTVIAVLTVVKPAAFWVVKLTKTEKDDAFVKRLYDVVEGTAIDWKPYVALFRRRNPKAAEVLDKFTIKDKDEDA